MGKYAWSLFLIFAGIFCSGVSYGQSIKDPNCYIPTLDNPLEIDSIYGSKNSQGFILLRLPPKPGETKSRLAISGLDNSFDFGYFVLDPNKPFDLHNPVIAAHMNTPLFDNYQVHFGHFHNTRLTDMLVDYVTFFQIYWSDENGLYDSSRISYSGDKVGVIHPGIGLGDIPPLIIRDPGDSVDDVLFGERVSYGDTTRNDTLYLLRYKGGENLYSPGSDIYPSARYFIDTVKSKSPGDFRIVQGDFRGTGNQDIIALNRDVDLMYYRNNGIFDPSEFARSLKEDTLLAGWQNPELFTPFSSLSEFSLQGGIVDRVLSKPDDDSSKDLIVQFERTDLHGYEVAIIPGSPDLGTSRLFLKSIPKIRTLGDLASGYDQWGLSQSMTVGQFDHSKNGNKFLFLNYALDSYYYNIYVLYMLGDAFDDEADMYFETPYPYYEEDSDTMDANGDGLSDLILAVYQYSPIPNVTGSIDIIYGTNKIPHLTKSGVNEDFLGSVPASCKVINLGDGRIKVLCDSLIAGTYSAEIRDILGRLIEKREFYSSGAGKEDFIFDLSKSPQGTYIILIGGEKISLHNKFLLIR